MLLVERGGYTLLKTTGFCIAERMLFLGDDNIVWNNYIFKQSTTAKFKGKFWKHTKLYLVSSCFFLKLQKSKQSHVIPGQI